jgi:acyl carrier protein
MTRAEAKGLIERKLEEIAPEVDAAAIDPELALRDQVDLDSIDFLNLIAALSEEIGADIPERDYESLETLDEAIDYLVRRST